jgi:spectinomycin phosphotransferase
VERLQEVLRAEYGLDASSVTFLPLGADINTAVYRATAGDASYFVKLRRGTFNPVTVLAPHHLHRQGVPHLIPPLLTRAGAAWTGFDEYAVVLFPFVDGRNGFHVRLTERQWRDLGAALKRLHTVQLPPALARSIRRETYTPHWRGLARRYLAQSEAGRCDDPVAAGLGALLHARRDQILDLVGRAERLAAELEARPREFVLCHSDVHAGNVLVDGNDDLYIVDWDDPILAPKERDLMYAGGAQGFVGYTAQEEETLFYRGYGPTAVDPAALAYYRYERIVQDIAVFSELILSTGEGGDDRGQSLRYLASDFVPNNTIETAYMSDRTRRDG